MKMPMLMVAAALGAWLVPGFGAAQDDRWYERNGFVRAAGGAWARPTLDQVIEALRAAPDGGLDGRDAAKSVLTQRYEARSRAELDAFAETLVELALAVGSHDHEVDSRIGGALVGSSRLGDEEGVPYEGAFDAARRIYEGRVASVPPEERGDPFRHIQGAAGWGSRNRAVMALATVYWIDPEGRGGEYLRRVIAAAALPYRETIQPERSTWCAAVGFIFDMHGVISLPGEELTRAELIARGLRHVEEALRDLPGDAALFERACGVGGVRSSS